MRLRTLTRVTALLAVLVVSAPVLAQNPTGTLTGQVTYQNEPLPGVTVSVQSTALQGSRTAITGVNGDYTFKFLPPGEYRVVFSLDGFRQLEQNVKISVAQTRTIDAIMLPDAVTEEIVVTSSYETISSASQSSSTFEQSLVEDLPVARDLNNAVLLAPGTTSTGPNDGITIAGAQSWENLFLVNGVVVNENVRGQAFDLFIEDAIEETTTSVSSVSAEYGRFGGGVVNMITKSGGNELSGSFRVNLQNDDWTASTPLTTSKVDEIDEIYEATLGGYLLKDRLWFFLAGRDRTLTNSAQFFNDVPYTNTDDQQRYEAKLTVSPHQSHRFIGSYIDMDWEQLNNAFNTPVEPAAIDPSRTLPSTLFALNYTGVLSDNLFVEAQYSEREFTFEDSGGTAAPGDRINGTEIFMSQHNASANSRAFCGQCGDEERDNENILVKGSYFLSTENVGTHDIVFGYDNFSDIRQSNNFQTPSNFRVWNYDNIDATNPVTGGSMSMYGPDGQFYPVFRPGVRIDLDYWPIFITSLGNDFTTESVYVNDTWRASSRLTVSAGVRYDANDGVDGAGNQVADDSRLSPRLGVTLDVFGDGDWLVHGGFARYVTAIANTVGDTAGGGSPSFFGYVGNEYDGPYINATPEGVYTHEYTSPEAMQILFDWFDGVGGLANTDLWYTTPTIRGFNTIVDNLDSTFTDEVSLGVTKRLGAKGLVRADYVHREGGDFYVTRRDLSTGTIDVEVDLTEGVTVSDTFDFGVVENDDDLLRREYDGLHTQFQYRLSDRLSLGGNWTWSHSRGNFDGETANAGPVTSGVLSYPEYKREEWNYPTGDLAIDQRHKVRAWAVWEAVSTARHNLSVSVLQNFWSGQPYGASQQVVAGFADVWIPNPGYENPPTFATYWFTNRDAFRTDDITRTDLSLNYSFFASLFGAEVELFVQPEVLNVFDEEGVVNVDTSVTAPFFAFNPYEEEPVEGVDWEKGETFGQPARETDYQTPRTFRLSVGFRF